MEYKVLNQIPKPLLTDLVYGRWLPVVGAGLSRNAIVPAKKTMPLWDELGNLVVAEMLDYPYSGPIDAISAFEHEFDRSKLIELLTRLLHIDEGRPGKVHEEFCSIPFDIVCTTNCDFLLEKQYEKVPRLCVPLIDEDQLSIGVDKGVVQLLKLHGDLHHPNRLVVTETDYDLFLVRFPMIATYLSNLLITRTAVLIGYSLDDPDFRNLWRIVNDRLGHSTRKGYVLLVDASPSEIAKYGRRNIKVINLSGNKRDYKRILETLFRELSVYWKDNFIETSQVTEEGPLRELALPIGTRTRLCFFGIPLSLHSFYKERVFPVIREAGLIPVTADDVISAGDNIIAKLEVLIERSSLVIIDVSSGGGTRAEAAFAMKWKKQSEVILITGEEPEIGYRVLKSHVIRRPDITSEEISVFLNQLREIVSRRASSYRNEMKDEPRRLLEAGEYRAAVIAAITRLESFLRTTLDNEGSNRNRFMGLREMVMILSSQRESVRKMIPRILDWSQIRNQVVHTNAEVTRKTATEIVNGVETVIELLG